MRNKGRKLTVSTLLLLVVVITLIFLPLFIQREAEFGGADGQAEEAVAEIVPGYEPWFQSIWEPPSGEVESLFFSLQAAVGSGIVCYCLGFLRGRRKGEEDCLKNVQN